MQTAVIEHPILFSAPMVNAILEGRKTQTRRILKLPKWSTQDWNDFETDGSDAQIICSDTGCLSSIKYPFGAPGHHLWVKETFAEYPTDGCYIHRADEGAALEAMGTDLKGCWKPSIFMPRKASRITLLVKNIRVERLQEISEQDAIAEGVERLEDGWKCYGNCPEHEQGYDRRTSAKASFMSLWNSINGKTYPWDSNPFVWVVEFERVGGGLK